MNLTLIPISAAASGFCMVALMAFPKYVYLRIYAMIEIVPTAIKKATSLSSGMYIPPISMDPLSDSMVICLYRLVHRKTIVLSKNIAVM